MTERVYDIKPNLEYICIKETLDKVRIWGAYCTYYRWDWDTNGRWTKRDDIILFNGECGKNFKYQLCYRNDRLDSYFNKHKNNGYRNITNTAEARKYDFILDGAEKFLMWHKLRS